MKKRLITLVLGLLLLLTAPVAASGPCTPLWDRVAGQTYDLQGLDVEFSPSGSGPCPQGTVQVFDGVYVAPRLECTYMSAGDNLIRITCNDVEMYFILIDDTLVYIDPSAPMMSRKPGG